MRAAREVGIEAQLIDHDDASDIAEFDALFIRETTFVNHSTYRLARRAATEGLVVIDDPISILRCTNKVFLAELFDRNAIPHPETVVAHEDTVEKIAATVGLPCVLKRPDSAFSQGVVRVDTEAELLARRGRLPARLAARDRAGVHALRVRLADRRARRRAAVRVPLPHGARPLADRRPRGRREAPLRARGGGARSTTRRPRRCAWPCARRG